MGIEAFFRSGLFLPLGPEPELGWALAWAEPELGQARAIARRFFDFSRTAPNGTPTCESISGRHSFESCLKSRCYRRRCPRKVKKHIAPERHRITKYRYLHQVRAIWNSSADTGDTGDPADQVSETAARTLPSTRAGGQDDGS